MIGLALAFLAGLISGVFLPTSFRDRLAGWVRGAAGAVGGRKPPAASARPKPFVTETAKSEKRLQTTVVQGLANLLRGAGRVLAFILSNPLLIVCIGVAVVAFVVIPSFFGFGKSKDTLRAERDQARIERKVSEHEAEVAREAAVRAEETHRDRDRVRDVIAHTEEEIDHAVSVLDFDALYRAYRAGYDGPDGVWRGDGAGRPDSGARRPEDLRGAGASPV